MLNSIFEELGSVVNEKQGLQKLAIEDFAGESKLEEWALGQLVLKTHKLQYLKLASMAYTTDENRSLLLKFAAKAVTSSSCLHTLHIEETRSSAADGLKFMHALADHEFN